MRVFFDKYQWRADTKDVMPFILLYPLWKDKCNEISSLSVLAIFLILIGSPILLFVFLCVIPFLILHSLKVEWGW